MVAVVCPLKFPADGEVFFFSAVYIYIYISVFTERNKLKIIILLL